MAMSSKLRGMMTTQEQKRKPQVSLTAAPVVGKGLTQMVGRMKLATGSLPAARNQSKGTERMGKVRGTRKR